MEIHWEFFLAQGWAGRRSVHFQQPMKIHRRTHLPSGQGIPCLFLARLARLRRAAPVAGIPESARLQHDDQSQTASSNHQIGHQNPRLLNCGLLPRRTTSTKKVRWAGPIMEKRSHGIARAIESMRRMRLPLVTCPEPGDGLLPGVPPKAEGLSDPGKPKAPRTSVPQAPCPGFCLG